MTWKINEIVGNNFIVVSLVREKHTGLPEVIPVGTCRTWELEEKLPHLRYKAGVKLSILNKE